MTHFIISYLPHFVIALTPICLPHFAIKLPFSNTCPHCNNNCPFCNKLTVPFYNFSCHFVIAKLPCFIIMLAPFCNKNTSLCKSCRNHSLQLEIETDPAKLFYRKCTFTIIRNLLASFQKMFRTAVWRKTQDGCLWHYMYTVKQVICGVGK